MTDERLGSRDLFQKGLDSIPLQYPALPLVFFCVTRGPLVRGVLSGRARLRWDEEALAAASVLAQMMGRTMLRRLANCDRSCRPMSSLRQQTFAPSWSSQLMASASSAAAVTVRRDVFHPASQVPSASSRRLPSVGRMDAFGRRTYGGGGGGGQLAGREHPIVKGPWGDAVIAIGSNEGDRVELFRRALRALRDKGIAGAWRTSP